MSYTTFDIGAPTPSAASFRDGEQVRVRIPGPNTREGAGSHIVHRTGADIARRKSGWQLDAGAYEPLLGCSSADIQTRVTIEVQAD